MCASCARRSREITHEGNLVRTRFGEEITHFGLVQNRLIVRDQRRNSNSQVGLDCGTPTGKNNDHLG